MSRLLCCIAGIMVCLAAGNVVLGCSIEDITSKLTKCQTISADDIASSSTTDILSSFCETLECNIRCYINAIGDCYLEDQFFTLNPTLIKVTNRAFCENQDETLSALIHCQWSDFSCLSTFATAVNSTLSQYNSGNYAAYKSEYCSALAEVLNCLDIVTTASCTSDLATLAEDFYKASFSYTTCGIAEHSFFSTYGGDIACDGAQLYQDMFLILFSIMINIVILNF